MAQPLQLVAVPARPAPETSAPLIHLEQRRLEVPPAPRADIGGAGRWILRTLLIGIALVAPVTAFAGQHRVMVDIEGAVRTVRTYATGSRDLLVRNGIRPASADLVSPSRSLKDGARVTFRRAKAVRLVLDGKPQGVVAHGLTVSQALADLGLVPGPNDHVFPDGSTRLRPGLEIFVRNAIHAKLRVDGELRDIVSSADTIRNMLAQAGVGLGDYDYVFPARTSVPRDGMWVSVVRVRHIVTETSVRIPYRFVTENDPNMESGTRRTVQYGAEGLGVQRYAVTLEDGRQVSSQLVSYRVVRAALDNIIRVGTREPSFTASGGSQQGEASWFNADGLVAAHPTLPIGSTVRVTDLDNGRSVVVRVTQRGPYAAGRIIDLSADAFQRLAPLGDGTIKVRVDS